MMRDFYPGDRVRFNIEAKQMGETAYFRGEGIVVGVGGGEAQGFYWVEPDWDTVEQDIPDGDFTEQVAMFYRWELSEVDDA